MYGAVLSLALVGIAPLPEGADETSEPGVAEGEPEASEPEDPDALAAEAQAAFAEGRFEEARALAKRAHELTGDPRHLYAQAVAERQLERCRDALILYARLLADVQDDPAYSALVDGTRQGIKLCEASLEEPEPEPEPPPIVAETSEPEPEPESVDPGPRPWFRDPLGGVMLGLGLAIAGGGGGTMWALSNRRLDEAEAAIDETVFADTRAQARGLRTGAIASMTLGGALLVGAVVRYGLVARTNRRQMAWIAPSAGGGAVLGWTRSF